MFVVIEKTFDKTGYQLSSEDIAEFHDEREAGLYVENRYSQGYADADENGVYCSFHIEEEKV